MNWANAGRHAWGAAARLLGLCWCAVILALAGCAANTQQSTPEGTEMAENDFLVRANTQVTFEDLKIGVGNIRQDECTDESGAKKSCLTAGLWIYYRDNAALDQQVRVQAGQTVNVGSYQVAVTEVDKDSKGSFVRMEIRK